MTPHYNSTFYWEGSGELYNFGGFVVWRWCECRTSCLVIKPLNGQHNVPTSSQEIEFHLNSKGLTHTRIQEDQTSSLFVYHFPSGSIKGGVPAVPVPAMRERDLSHKFNQQEHDYLLFKHKTGASSHKSFKKPEGFDLKVHLHTDLCWFQASHRNHDNL